jgi:hypothetical protein
MVWPFVNAFWADACLKTGRRDNYNLELFNLTDLGINKGQGGFWEIYDPETGLPDGGWQQNFHWGELENQTWSATGFLNMVWYGLAGIRMEEGKICFKPYLPEGIEYLTLTKLKYGNINLNIQLEGEGASIESFKINGQVLDNYEIGMDDYEGDVNIEITLKNDETGTNRPTSATLPFTSFSRDASIYVQLLNNRKADAVKLYDMTGKVVASEENATGNFILANNLPKGVFLLKMECENVVYTKKIIIL